MRKYWLPLLFITALITCTISLYANSEDETVGIYIGHFLLQSWPKTNKTITIEVDPNFPPDTLIFQAKNPTGGLKRTTLELQEMNGTTIQQVDRVTHLEDDFAATFIFVLNKDNLGKIKGKTFRVMLNRHQERENDFHSVALILLNRK